MRKFWKDYLTDDETKIILFLLIFAVIGLGLKYTSLIAEDSTEIETELDLSQDYEMKYDLTSVTVKELTTIPGIGQKKARDIVSYREQNGFHSKTDLMKIKGIGSATYAKIERFFNDLGNVSEFISDKAETMGSISEVPVEHVRLNINSASIEELVSLKGIGKTKAEAIIQYRKINDGFQKVDDLLNVKGIGRKTLDKIKDRIFTGVEDE
jgi:competence protein ComEA